ncbi:SRPBCC family protein [Pseudomonas asuensis]
MTNAYASIEIDVDANQIWQLMGGFGSLPDWLPFVVESQLSEGGRVRHLKDIEGNVIIERLLSFNEAEKLPVHHHRRTCSHQGLRLYAACTGGCLWQERQDRMVLYLYRYPYQPDGG